MSLFKFRRRTSYDGFRQHHDERQRTVREMMFPREDVELTGEAKGRAFTLYLRQRDKVASNRTRRDEFDKYFFGINTLILTFIGFVIVKKLPSVPMSAEMWSLITYACSFGFLIQVVWYYRARWYFVVGSAGHQVINEFERTAKEDTDDPLLPVRPNRGEWEYIKRALGQNCDPLDADRIVRRNFLMLGVALPVIFGAAFLVLPVLLFLVVGIR